MLPIYFYNVASIFSHNFSTQSFPFSLFSSSFNLSCIHCLPFTFVHVIIPIIIFFFYLENYKIWCKYFCANKIFLLKFCLIAGLRRVSDNLRFLVRTHHWPRAAILVLFTLTSLFVFRNLYFTKISTISHFHISLRFAGIFNSPIFSLFITNVEIFLFIELSLVNMSFLLKLSFKHIGHLLLSHWQSKAIFFQSCVSFQNLSSSQRPFPTLVLKERIKLH